jgi:hypothetical protein
MRISRQNKLKREMKSSEQFYKAAMNLRIRAETGKGNTVTEPQS